MAVLKSFELNGNKKSFANWISNLSPTSTPFTSMIGKEKIDQTQYSWQTDSLAPASAETFEEGSQATLQPRAATKIFTNFTSLVRRAARVSDTNECTHAYGRRDEMAYQMGMAGKAVLRDVEYMNLSTRRGQAGSATQASAHSGFKDLCAPLFMPDPDTFALTHQGVAVVDETKPWFALKDIFKVTTELFLAGSRADKIMFHPKHINIFSDHIGYNEEEPMMFRLFDGLDNKYNATVSKIKDPVGRVYTLVPNRWMPEGQVYIFSEKDWTQMVLQQPVRKQLAKKGSSNAIYIETEVGLQHKHPHASGVLDLIVVNYIGHLSLSKEKMTAFINDTANLTFTALNKDTSFAVGVNADISPSLELGLAFDKTKFTTNDMGTDSATVRADQPTKAVIFAYSDEAGKELVTNPITVEVVPPTVVFQTDGKVQAFKDSHIICNVTDAQGQTIDGHTLYLSADEGLEKARPTSDHAPIANGRAVFGISPSVVDKLHFRVAFEDKPDSWKTYPFEVDVEDNDFRLEFDKDFKTVLTESLVTNPMNVPVTLFDGDDLMAGESVVFKSSNESIITFGNDEYTTDTNGVATASMHIHSIGEVQITASFKNKAVSRHIRIGAGSAVLTLDRPVVELGDPNAVVASLQVFEADGSPAKVGGLDITWGSEPDGLEIEFGEDRTQTNSEGIATNTITHQGKITKGLIEALWERAGEFGKASYEVIPTQYRAEFDHNEYTIVGGDTTQRYKIPAKVVHDKDWADLNDHELNYSTRDLGIADWIHLKRNTIASGYADPANEIVPGDFGTTVLTVKGTDTDTEKCTSGTMVIHAVKPVVSFTADGLEFLEGDEGSATITLESPSGKIIDNFRGTLTVITDKNVVIPDSDTVTFGTSKATLKFTTVNKGTSEIRFALASGVEIPVKGRNLVEVVAPSVRVTTEPDTYQSGESVTVKVILSKPTTSTGDLSGKEVSITVEPDTLNGLEGTRTSNTDDTGTATFTSAAIAGNSDYTITARHNGVTATYELENIG